MRQCLILLLLLLSMHNVHAMVWFGDKNPNRFSTQRIQDMHADKSAFELLLQIKSWLKKRHSDEVPPIALIAMNYIKNTRSWGLSLLLRDFPETVIADSSIFLLYCYSQQFHEEQKKDIADYEHLLSYPALFTKCVEARIDGYSALGAAIIAPNISQKYKSRFISRLLTYNFTMTEKDKELLVLAVYDAMIVDQNEKEKIIYLLSELCMNNLSLLPLDVRKYIVAQMVLLVHKDYGLI